jgi:hypothetical protein
MFCPSCKSEYEPDVKECSECGVALVAVLTETFGADPNIKLVEVWRAQGEIDAQMARSILEASGVESMLQGESLRLTHGFTVDGLAEVRILVRGEDEARAREILKSSEQVKQCEHCGKANPVDTLVCRFCDKEMAG